MQTRPIDVHDDAQLRRFHEIGWRAEMEDGRPWNTFQSFEEMAVALREPSPGQRADALGIFDGDRMVGGGIAWLSLEDNLDKAFVFPAVEPDLRGRGIGGALLEALVEHVGGLGRTEVMSGSSYRFEERETRRRSGSPPGTASRPPTSRWCAGCRCRSRTRCSTRSTPRWPRTPPATRSARSSTTCPTSCWSPTASWSTSSRSTPRPATWSSRRRRSPPRRSGTRRPVTARSGAPCCAASRSGTVRPSRTATCSSARTAPARCSGRRSCTATTGGTGSAPRSRSPTCAGCSASGRTRPRWSPRTPRSTRR